MSIDGITTTSPTAVKVSDVRLVAPHGVRLVQAYFVPDFGPSQGVAFPWPVPKKVVEADARGWRLRETARGATRLNPEVSRRWWLSMHLRTTQAVGAHYKEVAVDYEVAGKTYLAYGNVSVTMKRRCS